ncbi:GFA family protein [Streptomyces sp. NPDC051130]|uniref:GFA family protein n=1 Tax=Streptomyces sp. NPDC051130 TaxID=3157223 RepID=UPI003441A17C
MPGPERRSCPGRCPPAPPREPKAVRTVPATLPTGVDHLNALPSTAPRSGGCLCRRIQFTVSGPPDYPHTCSCPHCQELSGGPMMAWVSFPLNSLKWTGDGGEPAWHYTWPDSRRGFCPRCGSQLCALDDGATSIAVTLPALGNPADLVPVNQSYRDTAVPWLPQVPDTRHHRPA